MREVDRSPFLTAVGGSVAQVLGFTQVTTPVGGVPASTLLALAPVFTLLVLLAVFKVTAWIAAIGGSIVTVLLAIFAWQVPAGKELASYGLGSATGVWSVDWIVFWGVLIYNTLVVTGAFDRFKQWLIVQATADIRVQTILLAWAFGALLEGLVGFGYPWAVVAPILIAFGVVELEAIRVSAIANNAPVSFGALGAPIIGLSKVTNLKLYALAASVGKIVAILALLPPWVLLYLVSGWRGMRRAWPLAVVGSFAYIAGQFPISQFAGPYLPDITGSLVCFAAILVLLRFWRPAETLGFGGKPIEEIEPGLADEPVAAERDHAAARERSPERSRTSVAVGGGSRGRARGDGGGNGMSDEVKDVLEHRDRFGWRDGLKGFVPFLILVAVVVAWTGPWSGITDYKPFAWAVSATSALTHKAVKVDFSWNPFVAGTSILASWLVICAYLRPKPAELATAFRTSFRQVWGALLVGVFIFGLAYAFNYSGMAASMAFGFSKVGTAFIVLSPILGWIAVALSGSNTASNAVFGAFQATVAKLLHAPMLLFPSLNSVGAEVGKPVAPQTASVGVSTTRFVRNEGQVIRHNMGWTLIVLVYLIGVGALYYFVLPAAMRP
jgi:lactate permease